MGTRHARARPHDDGPDETLGGDPESYMQQPKSLDLAAQWERKVAALRHESVDGTDGWGGLLPPGRERRRESGQAGTRANVREGAADLMITYFVSGDFQVRCSAGHLAVLYLRQAYAELCFACQPSPRDSSHDLCP